MSLGHFEDAWVERMLAARLGQELPEPTGLSSVEHAALMGVPLERVQAIAGGIMEGRVSMFVSATPSRLKTLLGQKRLRKSAFQFAQNDPLATLYPLSEALLKWLNFLLQEYRGAEIPHFESCLVYESANLALSLWRKPRAREPLDGPVLAPHVGLLVASPELGKVLAQIKAQESVADLPQTPQTGYVVWQSWKGLALKAVHWAVYEVLLGLDGQKAWPDVCRLVCEHHQLSDLQALLAWEDFFKQRRLIEWVRYPL